MPRIRINRALASSGVASRRGAEALVRGGRVRLNGQVVTDLATTVDPARDKLMLDGRALKLQPPAYYAFHKPRGLVATMHDENGRPCVGDVCRGLPGAPRPVGRLDRTSEGLLLLTNDGGLAHRLMHPRYSVQKEYQATVEPRLTDRHARQLVSGVQLPDGMARFATVALRQVEGQRSRLSVVATEGRHHLVRRAFAALGYEVLRLKRVRVGGLTLGKLAPGQSRSLTSPEVRELRRLTGLL